MANDNLDEFELIAVSRDLFRKPEVKFLAGILYNLATGAVDKSEIPPVYIMIAHRLLTKPGAKALLLNVLEAI